MIPGRACNEYCSYIDFNPHTNQTLGLSHMLRMQMPDLTQHITKHE